MIKNKNPKDVYLPKRFEEKCKKAPVEDMWPASCLCTEKFRRGWKILDCLMREKRLSSR